MTEYNPLEVCPAAFKLAHEVGIPEYVGLGLTSAYPIKLSKPEGKFLIFWGSIYLFLLFTCVARQFGEIAVNTFD
jgi:hypothetical protein